MARQHHICQGEQSTAPTHTMTGRSTGRHSPAQWSCAVQYALSITVCSTQVMHSMTRHSQPQPYGRLQPTTLYVLSLADTSAQHTMSRTLKVYCSCCILKHLYSSYCCMCLGVTECITRQCRALCRLTVNTAGSSPHGYSSLQELGGFDFETGSQTLETPTFSKSGSRETGGSFTRRCAVGPCCKMQ
jgi:hypothetical protein